MFDAKKLLDTLINASSEGTSHARQKANELGASDFGSNMRDIFGQATEGVKDGASQINQKTGAGDALNDMLEQFGGGSAGELLEQAQEWAGNNKGAAGGILGGLGALVLGTRAGRGLAMDAAKIGGLALIAGLAYKAYQNHQDGKPLITRNSGAPEVPPSGSGYEVAAVSNEDATLYLRAMIAGAASDGHIDAGEQKAIMGGIRDAGMSADAAQFLEDQFSNPASIDDLADAVATEQQAAQVYTAARVTIGGDNEDERDFLERLGYALDLEYDHVAHINAEVQGVQV